jgi:quercetin dioxygenase-like cupin family protein
MTRWRSGAEPRCRACSAREVAEGIADALKLSGAREVGVLAQVERQGRRPHGWRARARAVGDPLAGPGLADAWPVLRARVERSAWRRTRSARHSDRRTGEVGAARGLAPGRKCLRRRRRAERRIYRSRLKRGTRIPAHLHPGAVEHMLAVEGVVETTGGRCKGGESWTSPPGVEHGRHLAVTDVEFITISIGAEGTLIVESPAATHSRPREAPRRAAGSRCQPEPFEGNALTAARRPS